MLSIDLKIFQNKEKNVYDTAVEERKYFFVKIILKPNIIFHFSNIMTSLSEKREKRKKFNIVGYTSVFRKMQLITHE